MAPPHVFLPCVLAMLITGCSPGELFGPAGPSKGDGQGAGGDSDQDADGKTQFLCDASKHTEAAPLRRLSRVQYENVLRDLLVESVGNDLANAALTQAVPSLALIPADSITKEAAFARMDQVVTQEHVDAYFRVANTIASSLTGSLTASTSGVRALLGACSTASVATEIDKCIDEFVLRFGARALRKPITADDLSFYRGVYAVKGSIDAKALSDVVRVMLSAPELLYVVEGAGPAQAEPGLFALTPYELAVRLSLHFWQTAPDAELRALAESSELSSEAGYRAAVERMAKDPRAQRTVESFVREWFALDALRPLDSLVGTPVFDAFVGKDVPSPDLRDDMIADLSESLRYHAFERADGLEAWLTSQYSFARTPELAAIYEVPVWNGSSTPPSFPEGARAGLLTRAGLLATGSANTRPIMKGVFIREKLLCDGIAPPPNNAADNPPELSSELTTREVVEALTETEGSSCAGCHSTQINGLGFPSEGFDALGRARDGQALFSEAGSLITTRQVDTQAIPRVWLNDERSVSDVQELTDRILESGKVEACFARQYLRFTYGREEDSNTDGCVLETMRASLASGAPLSEAFSAPALSPAFQQRFIPEET